MRQTPDIARHCPGTEDSSFLLPGGMSNSRSVTKLGADGSPDVPVPTLASDKSWDGFQSMLSVTFFIPFLLSRVRMHYEIYVILRISLTILLATMGLITLLLNAIIMICSVAGTTHYLLSYPRNLIRSNALKRAVVESSANTFRSFWLSLVAVYRPANDKAGFNPLLPLYQIRPP